MIEDYHLLPVMEIYQFLSLIDNDISLSRPISMIEVYHFLSLIDSDRRLSLIISGELI